MRITCTLSLIAIPALLSARPRKPVALREAVARLSYFTPTPEPDSRASWCWRSFSITLPGLQLSGL